MSTPVLISMQLNVYPGGFVMIPGCEPSSELTSTHMAAEMRELGLCTRIMVPVKEVLDNIPGTYLKTIDNAGQGQTQARRILVFPACSQTCPITCCEDWYQLLRDIGEPATDEQITALTGCDSFSIGCSGSGGFGGGAQPEWRPK